MQGMRIMQRAVQPECKRLLERSSASTCEGRGVQLGHGALDRLLQQPARAERDTISREGSCWPGAEWRTKLS